MGEENATTFTTEKDGTIVVKDGEASVRYVKESDLLALKGSKEGIENAVKAAEAARDNAVAEATSKVEIEHQKALQAEARVSSLEDQIRMGGGSAAELVKAKADLEAAKRSSEELGNKHLELRRNVIVATYGVPKETVESKDLTALDLFEEALKSIIGNKAIGNFAIGGGGGGASALQGKKPYELAVDAYSQSK